MRGLSDEYGILEDDLHVAARVPQRAARERQHVFAR